MENKYIITKGFILLFLMVALICLVSFTIYSYNQSEDIIRQKLVNIDKNHEFCSKLVRTLYANGIYIDLEYVRDNECCVTNIIHMPTRSIISPYPKQMCGEPELLDKAIRDLVVDDLQRQEDSYNN